MVKCIGDGTNFAYAVEWWPPESAWDGVHVVVTLRLDSCSLSGRGKQRHGAAEVMSIPRSLASRALQLLTLLGALVLAGAACCALAATGLFAAKLALHCDPLGGGDSGNSSAALGDDVNASSPVRRLSENVTNSAAVDCPATWCDELQPLIIESVIGSLVIHAILLAISIVLLLAESQLCPCFALYLGFLALRSGRGALLLVAGAVTLSYSRTFVQPFEDERLGMGLVVDTSLFFTAAGGFAIGVGLLPLVAGLLSCCCPSRIRLAADPLWETFAALGGDGRGDEVEPRPPRKAGLGRSSTRRKGGAAAAAAAGGTEMGYGANVDATVGAQPTAGGEGAGPMPSWTSNAWPMETDDRI